MNELHAPRKSDKKKDGKSALKRPPPGCISCSGDSQPGLSSAYGEKLTDNVPDGFAVICSRGGARMRHVGL